MFGTMTKHKAQHCILTSLLLSQEVDACHMLEPPETSASATHLEDDDIAMLPVSNRQM